MTEHTIRRVVIYSLAVINIQTAYNLADRKWDYTSNPGTRKPNYTLSYPCGKG